MAALIVRGGGALEGAARVPGDKAIGHRGLMLGAAASGTTVLRGLSSGEDVESTRRCLEGYGVRLPRDDDEVRVHSEGLSAWVRPDAPLDCRNSGTTMRILSGLAARCPFETVLDGDESLRRRPMDRVAEPLRALGATVDAREGRLPPLRIAGGHLRGAEVRVPVASGQVKSAVLLAGLGAEGTTALVEPAISRDDTERMLSALGVPVRSHRLPDGGVRVELERRELPPFELDVPGDLSSAAFLVVAALLAGRVRLDDVALNPTRTGFLDALVRMGAAVRWETTESRLGEPVGWIEAERGELGGIGLEGPIIPSLLDELPALALLATQARGKMVVTGATELRVKESDRIAALAEGLGRLGADFTELPDGFVVSGPTPLAGSTVDSWGDHRIAIALAIAGLVADGETRVTGWEAAAVSWPGFERVLAGLGAECRVERA